MHMPNAGVKQSLIVLASDISILVVTKMTISPSTMENNYHH